MLTFRLATLNVHSFRYATYDNNISELVSILRPFNLDLLAVQEILNDDKWKKFCTCLSLNYSIYGKCNGDSFSNGIASHYPILSHSDEISLSCPNDRRSLLQCHLDHNHPFIKDRSFAVIHLSYLNEDDRLKQLKDFNAYKENIDILMGDMNALTREDYSNDYYRNTIVDIWKQYRWGKPRFDLTKLIKDEWGLSRCIQNNESRKKKNEQIVTCNNGTRVDYIYVHPRINNQWTLNKMSHY